MAWQTTLQFGFTSSILYLALHLPISSIPRSLTGIPSLTAWLAHFPGLYKAKEEHSLVSGGSSLESSRASSSRLNW